MSKNLIAVAADLDNASRLTILRAVANNTLTKSVYAIRNTLVEESRLERSANGTLDQRNFFDENDRSAEELDSAAGFERRESHSAHAAKLAAVAKTATLTISQLSLSAFDRPMTLKTLLDYMLRNTAKPNMQALQQLAMDLELPLNTVLQSKQAQMADERARLVNDIPQITAAYEALEECDDLEDGFTNLSAVDQYVAWTKAIEAMQKSIDKLTDAAIRYNSIKNAGLIKVMKADLKQLMDDARAFETANRDELTDAIDQGARFRTLDDIARGL